jgi:hypothetical protein
MSAPDLLPENSLPLPCRQLASVALAQKTVALVTGNKVQT